jgi:Na+/citrate or Na+/malate symporter
MHLQILPNKVVIFTECFANYVGADSVMKIFVAKNIANLNLHKSRIIESHTNKRLKSSNILYVFVQQGC